MPATTPSYLLYRRLLAHIRPYWRPFALAIAAMVVLAATQPILPALLKPLLDGSFVDRDLDLVERSALILVAVFVVRGASSYLSTLGLAYVGGRLVLDLRSAMFEKLITRPSTRGDQTDSGALISKITFDATQVTDAGTRVLKVLVADLLTIIALLGWMAYLEWRLTLLALLSAPVVIGTVRYFSRRLRQMSRNLQQKMGEVTHRVRETLDGEKVVKIFAGQSYERQRFHEAANWARRYQLKFASAANATGPIAQLAVSIALAVIIYVSAQRASANQLSVGEFVSFLTAMVMIFPPIRRLTAVNSGLQQGLAAAESVFALIDEQAEPDAGTCELGQVRGHLVLEHVSFRYPGTEYPTLEDVCFEVNPGEMVALVGPSGSGKTTLAHLVPRFYEPTAGVIRLDGVDITELSLASLRRHIALVDQEVVLFNDTVAANIAYGALADAPPEAILEAAHAAHLGDFLDRLPDGLRSVVGEHGVRISGGQRQRIAIARAFLKDAPILILDEATSALDPDSERRVQDALERLRVGRATLVIAHRLSTIEAADRIVVMSDGRVAESGTHRSLLRSSGLYAGLYRLQFMGQNDSESAAR